MRGAGFSPIHSHALFSPCSKKKKKKKKKVFVCLGLFPGQGQRPLPVCPKDTTRWEGEGESMCQEIQRICHSCDSGLFQKQANFDDSLDGSHPRSFLERIRVAGVRCAPASARGPLQPSRLGCGSHLHSPPAGPPRIASFKCRKLSSQVRAFGLPGVSLY